MRQVVGGKGQTAGRWIVGKVSITIHVLILNISAFSNHCQKGHVGQCLWRGQSMGTDEGDTGGSRWCQDRVVIS